MNYRCGLCALLVPFTLMYTGDVVDTNKQNKAEPKQINVLQCGYYTEEESNELK